MRGNHLVPPRPLQRLIGQGAADVRKVGADLIVAGSAIFGMEDLPRAYRRLVKALE